MILFAKSLASVLLSLSLSLHLFLSLSACWPGTLSALAAIIVTQLTTPYIRLAPAAGDNQLTGQRLFCPASSVLCVCVCVCVCVFMCLADCVYLTSITQKCLTHGGFGLKKTSVYVSVCGGVCVCVCMYVCSV